MFLRQGVKILWEAKKITCFEKQTKTKTEFALRKKEPWLLITWILMKSTQEAGLEEELKKSSFMEEYIQS